LGYSVAQGVNNRMSEKKAGYAKFKLKPVTWLVRYPLVAVVMHWAFQSLFYMDVTERWFKLAIDSLLTLGGGLILSRWWPWPIAWLAAFFMAHTLNFLLNGQLWGVLKHYNLVRSTPEQFEAYVQNFVNRARREPAIRSVVVCGSVSRREWQPSSDFDARLMREAGWGNGLRACWFLLRERSRALTAVFPLDVYVLDNETSLKKLNPNDSFFFLYEAAHVDHNSSS
jgi:L-malate glycosyltransferase